MGWVNTPDHIVTLDEDGTIVIVNAKTGEKDEVNASDGRPQELCKGQHSGEIILEVRGGPVRTVT